MNHLKRIAIWIAYIHAALFCFDSAQGQENNGKRRLKYAVDWSTYQLKLKSGQSLEAKLGTISVPENRNETDSRRISIRFLKLEGRDSAKGLPIVYLAGGPGQSASATARTRRFELFDRLRNLGDVILFDQRGTGLSDGLPKWESDIQIPKGRLKTGQLYQELLTTDLKKAIQYWTSQGADYRGYTTDQSADDLDAIRAALGADKINLLGISYGTHLALNVIKRHEAHINRVVLVSAEGLEQTVKLPERTNAYFDRLQAAINADPDTAKRYPDVRGLMLHVQQSLVDRVQEQGVADALTPFELQRISSWFVSDPERLGSLLKAYEDSNNGRFGFFESLSRRSPKIRGMPELMDIASGISQSRMQKVRAQAEASPLGMALNFPMPLLSDALPEMKLGEEFRKNPTSTIPVLFFSGTLDGRTYPESHAEIAMGFQNHSTVTVKNAGHNLFFSHPEVISTIERFLEGEDVKSCEVVAPFTISNRD